MQMSKAISAIWLAVALPWLTGCDQLGLETPAKIAERQVAEAKAIGGACRHALRAIEDCYTLNAKADKSSVFAGWREMDEYMRENKLDGIAPTVARAPGTSASKPRKSDADEDESEVDEEEDEKSSAEPRARNSRSEPAEEVIDESPPKGATAMAASGARSGKTSSDDDRGKASPTSAPRPSNGASTIGAAK